MIRKGLQDQIDLAYRELAIIDKTAEPGAGHWRLMRRYIDGLEFAMEELRLDERQVRALEDISDYLRRIDGILQAFCQTFEHHEELMKALTRAIDAGMVFS